MLTKYQEKGFAWYGKLVKFMPEIPIRWDPVSKELSILPQKRKWFLWGFVQFFLLSNLYSSIHPILSEPFIHRKGFHVLHFCVLSTEFVCLSCALYASFGLMSPQLRLYVSAANNAIKVENEILSSKNRKT